MTTYLAMILLLEIGAYIEQLMSLHNLCRNSGKTYVDKLTKHLNYIEQFSFV